MRSRDYIHIPHKIGDKVADLIAAFIGSWPNVAIHTVWFTIWFDYHYDISLLTNVVSLEAIYLCIFLLMAANRQSAKDHTRDDHEAAEVDELMDIQKTQVKILNSQSDILELLKPKQE